MTAQHSSQTTFIHFSQYQQSKKYYQMRAEGKVADHSYVYCLFVTLL